ncbi:MAG: hypothetical protein ACJA13_003616 [Paraglaciecola sp.]
MQGGDLLLVLFFVQHYFFSLLEAVSGYVQTGNGRYQ